MSKDDFTLATLEEMKRHLNLPEKLDDLREQWLVLAGDTEPIFAQQRGLDRIQPIRLTDGRIAVCADGSTEWARHFADGFEKTKAVLATAEVISRQALQSLLPPRGEV